jgi:lipopolysaccharide export system protein LptA
MKARFRQTGLGAVLALFACAALLVPGAVGQTPPARPAPKPATTGSVPFAGFGSNSKEPIKVDSNKLEVFDKENRGVFSGDVVAVQGQTTVRCSVMTVFYAQQRAAGQPSATPTSAAAAQNSIQKIECQGPVSVVSGTQSATSKSMVYDALADTVTLTGSVVIADCDNVQRGERAVYDVKTGRATVDAGAKGRVQGIFTPGSDDKAKKPGECPPKRN